MAYGNDKHQQQDIRPPYSTRMLLIQKLGKQFPLREYSTDMLQFLNHILTPTYYIQWRAN